MHTIPDQSVELHNYLLTQTEIKGSKGIQFQSVLVAELIKSPWSGEDHNYKQDQFSCQFTGLFGFVTFDYWQGTGHRSYLSSAQATKVRKDRQRAGSGIIRASKSTPEPRSSRSSYRTIEYIKQPNAADLLYCVIMDAQARNECFDDWCDNFGYDTDSMKAMETYKACCANGKKLQKIFSNSQIEDIERILEDF